jgi:hypothetical protein
VGCADLVRSGVAVIPRVTPGEYRELQRLGQRGSLLAADEKVFFAVLGIFFPEDQVARVKSLGETRAKFNRAYEAMGCGSLKKLVEESIRNNSAFGGSSQTIGLASEQRRLGYFPAPLTLAWISALYGEPFPDELVGEIREHQRKVHRLLIDALDPSSEAEILDEDLPPLGTFFHSKAAIYLPGIGPVSWVDFISTFSAAQADPSRVEALLRKIKIEGDPRSPPVIPLQVPSTCRLTSFPDYLLCSTLGILSGFLGFSLPEKLLPLLSLLLRSEEKRLSVLYCIAEPRFLELPLSGLSESVQIKSLLLGIQMFTRLQQRTWIAGAPSQNDLSTLFLWMCEVWLREVPKKAQSFDIGEEWNDHVRVASAIADTRVAAEMEAPRERLWEIFLSVLSGRRGLISWLRRARAENRDASYDEQFWVEILPYLGVIPEGGCPLYWEFTRKRSFSLDDQRKIFVTYLELGGGDGTFQPHVDLAKRLEAMVAWPIDPGELARYVCDRYFLRARAVRFQKLHSFLDIYEGLRRRAIGYVNLLLLPREFVRALEEILAEITSMTEDGGSDAIAAHLLFAAGMSKINSPFLLALGPSAQAKTGDVEWVDPEGRKFIIKNQSMTPITSGLAFHLSRDEWVATMHIVELGTGASYVAKIEIPKGVEGTLKLMMSAFGRETFDEKAEALLDEQVDVFDWSRHDTVGMAVAMARLSYRTALLYLGLGLAHPGEHIYACDGGVSLMPEPTGSLPAYTFGPSIDPLIDDMCRKIHEPDSLEEFPFSYPLPLSHRLGASSSFPTHIGVNYESRLVISVEHSPSQQGPQKLYLQPKTVTLSLGSERLTVHYRRQVRRKNDGEVLKEEETDYTTPPYFSNCLRSHLAALMLQYLQRDPVLYPMYVEDHAHSWKRVEAARAAAQALSPTPSDSSSGWESAGERRTPTARPKSR